MSELFELAAAPAPEARHLSIYRAVADPTAFGMDDQGVLVAGLRLELVFEDGYNLLEEEFQNCGLDATTRIILPAEGLVAGRLYAPCSVNERRDWETGAIDEWDIELYLYQGEIPPPPPSAFDWDSPPSK